MIQTEKHRVCIPIDRVKELLVQEATKRLVGVKILQSKLTYLSDDLPEALENSEYGKPTINVDEVWIELSIVEQPHEPQPEVVTEVKSEPIRPQPVLNQLFPNSSVHLGVNAQKEPRWVMSSRKPIAYQEAISHIEWIVNSQRYPFPHLMAPQLLKDISNLIIGRPIDTCEREDKSTHRVVGYIMRVDSSDDTQSSKVPQLAKAN